MIAMYDLEENFEPKMKVKEFYKYIKAPLKIISGFNGKVLCRNYQPRLHDEKFGDRIITNVWSEVEIKDKPFGNVITPIIVCYVHGDVEYNSYKISLEVCYDGRKF